METATRRSRWDTRKRGIVRFEESDFEICRLLSSTREPWGYQYLPTSYFITLLNRGLGIRARLPKLSSHNYIQLPEQPRNNFRDLVYALNRAGVAELRAAGINVPTPALRRLPHELLCCITAASFEYGALKHGLSISLSDVEGKIYPDWPIFKMGNHHIFLEADMGSETLEGQTTATTIWEKYERYLELFNNRVHNGLAVFVTVRESRKEAMIELLKKVIDAKGYKHRLARNFIFKDISYDRYISKVPKLTDWAVAEDYQQAGNLTFNFTK
jgi:hypothetical protein